MNDAVILEKGMDILFERLGLVDAARFIYLIKKNQCNYTEFRHALFEGMSMDDICREAEQVKIEADERNR